MRRRGLMHITDMRKLIQQVEERWMKKLPAKLPKFKGDKDIAAFMEEHSAFDLVDAGLAEIIPTPFFVRHGEEKLLLSNRGERRGTGSPTR